MNLRNPITRYASSKAGWASKRATVWLSEAEVSVFNKSVSRRFEPTFRTWFSAIVHHFRLAKQIWQNLYPSTKDWIRGEPLSTGLLEQIERIPTPPAAHHPLNPFPKSVNRSFSERHPVRPLVVGDRIWQNSFGSNRDSSSARYEQGLSSAPLARIAVLLSANLKIWPEKPDSVCLRGKNYSAEPLFLGAECRFFDYSCSFSSMSDLCFRDIACDGAF
ncbi:MAG: hypothetical protein FJ010_09250, partial [Chloroflexi bacterium]|nr:hypothetical protein [Chloroflexota bacterium]